MKYWVFQNNQVVGPFDREAIGEVAGFSSDSLVCPEGRKGTQMGDWTRAGVVPELAEALLAATRIPAMARGGIERGSSSLLPPEPTLRDLAVLGSLQERVGALETLANRLQDELRSRDTEISRLKIELDQKARSASELQTKFADLEVKTINLAGVKDELERAREDARAAAERIEEHQLALQDLQEKVNRPVPAPAASPADFVREAPPPLSEAPTIGPAPASLGPLPAVSPLMAPPAPQSLSTPSPVPVLETPAAAPPMVSTPPMAAPMAPPMARPMGGAKGGGMGRLGELEAFPAEAAAPAPDLLSGPPGAGPDLPAFDPFALPAANLPAGEAPEPIVSLRDLPSPSSPAFKPPPAPVKAPAVPASTRDLRVVGVIAAMALCAGAGVYMLQGKKPVRKSSPKPASAAAATPLPAGGAALPEHPPVATPPVPPPAEDLTQAAVDFVKGYQIPGRQETVAMLLESRYPTTGRLSPWMVEKLDGDKYAVNFWATQAETAPGPKPQFQFQVRVRARLLEGLNPPAIALLNDGSVPKPEGPRARRRGRKRAATSSAARPAPSTGSGQAGPPVTRISAKGKKAKAKPVDAAAEIMKGMNAGATAAEPPAPPAPKPAKSKGKARIKFEPAPKAAPPKETQLPPEIPADETSTTSAEEAPAASAGQSVEPRNPADAADDDQMLDQLLLPGAAKGGQKK
ncbi:MAG: hypothetical protein NTX64_18825 [Elusimicrobia bacterium]|nr:hypothetical protein [Elusimicrobiota bacterium]